MLTLLFKQPLNIWRTLELRHKIESLLLFILIYAFIATRLNTLFKTWTTDGASSMGITLLLSHVFIFILTLSALLILRWFIPKQRSVNMFISKPLDNRQIIKILSYYSFKYLSVYLILLLPVITALLANFGLYQALLSFATTLLVSYSFLLLFFVIENKYKAGNYFIFWGALTLFAYHGLFAVIYWQTNFLIFFQIIILICALAVIVYFFNYYPGFLTIDNFLGYKKKEITRPDIVKARLIKVAQVFPSRIQALFEKELFSLWRNRYYIRLKIQSFLIFIILGILIITTHIEHKEIWIVIMSCIITWLHYSNNFNEKYVIADPEWLIRTLPIRFRHIFIAKYLAEIAFVLLLLLSDVLLLQFSNASLTVQIYNLAFIFIFAHLVLFTMLNFQIMFYENTRLAAYAYHFSLLFIAIMILNYRLVGPVITLGLLIFFFYKNVKYFNN
jgi:hypothetical protein